MTMIQQGYLQCINTTTQESEKLFVVLSKNQLSLYQDDPSRIPSLPKASFPLSSLKIHSEGGSSGSKLKNFSISLPPSEGGIQLDFACPTLSIRMSWLKALSSASPSSPSALDKKQDLLKTQSQVQSSSTVGLSAHEQYILFLQQQSQTGQAKAVLNTKENQPARRASSVPKISISNIASSNPNFQSPISPSAFSSTLPSNSSNALSPPLSNTIVSQPKPTTLVEPRRLISSQKESFEPKPLPPWTPGHYKNTVKSPHKTQLKNASSQKIVQQTGSLTSNAKKSTNNLTNEGNIFYPNNNEEFNSTPSLFNSYPTIPPSQSSTYIPHQTQPQSQLQTYSQPQAQIPSQFQVASSTLTTTHVSSLPQSLQTNVSSEPRLNETFTLGQLKEALLSILPSDMSKQFDKEEITHQNNVPVNENYSTPSSLPQNEINDNDTSPWLSQLSNNNGYSPEISPISFNTTELDSEPIKISYNISGSGVSKPKLMIDTNYSDEFNEKITKDKKLINKKIESKPAIVAKKPSWGAPIPKPKQVIEKEQKISSTATSSGSKNLQWSKEAAKQKNIQKLLNGNTTNISPPKMNLNQVIDPSILHFRQKRGDITAVSPTNLSPMNLKSVTNQEKPIPSKQGSVNPQLIQFLKSKSTPNFSQSNPLSFASKSNLESYKKQLALKLNGSSTNPITGNTLVKSPSILLNLSQYREKLSQSPKTFSTRTESTPPSVSLDTDAAEWHRLSVWLSSIGLGHHLEKFYNEGIRKLSVLELLSEEDLRKKVSLSESETTVLIKKLNELSLRIQSFIPDSTNVPDLSFFSSSSIMRSNSDNNIVVPKKLDGKSTYNSSFSSFMTSIQDMPRKERSVSLSSSILPTSPSHLTYNKVNINIPLDGQNLKRDLLHYYKIGDLDSFFTLWHTSLSSSLSSPMNSNSSSSSIRPALRNAKTAIEFHLYLFFCVKAIQSNNKQNIKNSKFFFRNYLEEINSLNFNLDAENQISKFQNLPNNSNDESKNNSNLISLTNSREFATFASIVFVPTPQLNPAFSLLFTDEWSSALENRLLQFIDAVHLTDITNNAKKINEIIYEEEEEIISLISKCSNANQNINEHRNQEEIDENLNMGQDKDQNDLILGGDFTYKPDIKRNDEDDEDDEIHENQPQMDFSGYELIDQNNSVKSSSIKSLSSYLNKSQQNINNQNQSLPQPNPPAIDYYSTYPSSNIQDSDNISLNSGISQLTDDTPLQMTSLTYNNTYNNNQIKNLKDRDQEKEREIYNSFHQQKPRQPSPKLKITTLNKTSLQQQVDNYNKLLKISRKNSNNTMNNDTSNVSITPTNISSINSISDHLPQSNTHNSEIQQEASLFENSNSQSTSQFSFPLVNNNNEIENNEDYNSYNKQFENSNPVSGLPSPKTMNSSSTPHSIYSQSKFEKLHNKLHQQQQLYQSSSTLNKLTKEDFNNKPDEENYNKLDDFSMNIALESTSHSPLLDTQNLDLISQASSQTNNRMIYDYTNIKNDHIFQDYHANFQVSREENEQDIKTSNSSESDSFLKDVHDHSSNDENNYEKNNTYTNIVDTPDYIKPQFLVENSTNFNDDETKKNIENIEKVNIYHDISDVSVSTVSSSELKKNARDNAEDLVLSPLPSTPPSTSFSIKQSQLGLAVKPPQRIFNNNNTNNNSNEKIQIEDNQ